MSDFLKKGFLIGLGATLASKEKAENFLDDLSKSGGAAAEEAKAFLTTLNDKGKDSTDKWRDGLRQDVIDAIKDLGFVSQDEYTQVQEKLAVLESELAELKKTMTNKENNEN